jgi:DUF4097 and DUF4098 domain-containing protein YvlB
MTHSLVHSIRRRGLAAPLALLLGLLSAGCHLTLRAEARDEWKRTYTLAEGGSLEIRNTNGRIQVDTAEGNTIEVVANRVAQAASDEDARAALGRMTITEDVSPSRVRLESTRSGVGLHLVSIRVDYTVRVPRWAAVTLVSTNGALQVTGLAGPFEARTTNGAVEARSLTGGAMIETTNGDVTLDIARLADRGIMCETTNGSVEITVPRDLKARLAASVTNGDIDVSGLDVTTSEKSRRRLEGSIGGGGALIRVETTNGGVRVSGR